MKRQNIIFIILILLIIAIGFLTLVREEKTISGTENRTLNKFDHFTLKSYITGEYQNKLELAMADQIFGSGTIKTGFKSMLQFINYKSIPKSVCKGRYVTLVDSYVNYDCDDYLLYSFDNVNEESYSEIKERIYNYNTINEQIDTYYYFISTSKIFDFESNKYTIDVIKILQENLKNEKAFSSLIINNYDDYTKYFYKTDHHWNYYGSYKGYADIMKMFNKNIKINKPVEEYTFENIKFYGSHSRYSQILDYEEKFKVYKFDLPNMKILANRKREGYGNEDNYFKGIYNKDKFANHYGLYYGDDDAEVLIEANSGKKNLLIIGNSFSNSVNKLIATHFNKTYDVDLRHYNSTFNENFNIKKYVEENDIHKVLFIMDYNFLRNKEFDIKWGE